MVRQLRPPPVAAEIERDHACRVFRVLEFSRFVGVPETKSGGHTGGREARDMLRLKEGHRSVEKRGAGRDSRGTPR